MATRLPQVHRKAITAEQEPTQLQEQAAAVVEPVQLA